MKQFSIKKFALYLCLAGAVLIGAAGVWCVSISHFRNQAIVTQGKVMGFSKSLTRNRTRPDSRPTTTTPTYAPIVRFVTEDGRSIEFISKAGSNPPRYSKGDTVEVLYSSSSPENATINDFSSLWMGPLIVGGPGLALVLLGAGIIVIPGLKGRKNERLRRTGTAVEADFQGIEKNKNLNIGGRNPFNVITVWRDPSTSETHTFRSDNLWYDPTGQIDREKITVFMERNNPKKYYVDLSFLPAQKK
jgi:hypothetical protein